MHVTKPEESAQLAEKSREAAETLALSTMAAMAGSPLGRPTVRSPEVGTSASETRNVGHLAETSDLALHPGGPQDRSPLGNTSHPAGARKGTVENSAAGNRSPATRSRPVVV